MSHSAEELSGLLGGKQGVSAIPEVAGLDLAGLRDSERGGDVLEWALEAGAAIPETTYSLYRQYQLTGERIPYERPYFDKRELLTQRVMAVWLGGDEAAIAGVNDVIWSICEETTWVLPAHERPDPWTVDLFAAETGVELAHALLLLGDRLPTEVRERVKAEVKRRILDPYLDHANDYWWDKGTNNWTGVCAGSVGQTFLLMDPDVERQSRAVEMVLGQLDRFIEHGFEPDGACLEGIGYWCYGLIHYVGFAEMLKAKTGGAIDLLSQDKLRAIAGYPATVALDKHVFASFSDSHEGSSIPPFLAARMADVTGVDALRRQIGDMTSWRLTTVLRNLAWWDGATGGEPRVDSAFMIESGIAKLVKDTPSGRVVLAAKAGHNAEPHNNNDVGSFILRVGGTTFLCDPGGGLYTKDYFGAKRYENIFANSYGHSVPRIGGRMQSEGAEFGGTLEKLSDDCVRISMNRAYPVPELVAAVRTFALGEDGSVRMDVEYRFDGDGMEVEEAFLTWLDVEVDGSIARVVSKEGVLEIRAEGGEFAAERLEEACKANKRRGVLTRVTMTHPAGKEVKCGYDMVFMPVAGE